MKYNKEISEKELTFLISNLIIVKMIFTFTRGLFTENGNSAWIETVFMSLIALTFLEGSFISYKICGKKSIIDVADLVWGSFFKYIIGLICIAVFLVNFVVEVRMFFESIKIVLLPQTEIEIIIVFTAIAVAIGAKKGINAIATVNAIFFPICLIFLGFIAIFLIKNYNINNLFPIFERGTENIFTGTFRQLSCFSDILALNFLMPHAKDIGVVRRSGRKAVIIASITLILICLCYALCYPTNRSNEFLLPVYQLTRMIKAGEYFQRFEAFFEFVWTITELLYITIYIFLISETLSKTFSVPDNKILVLPVVTTSFLLAIEGQSIVEALTISDKLGLVTYPIAFALPIIIPLLYLPKRRKERLSG